jgi:hypothetical protein
MRLNLRRKALQKSTAMAKLRFFIAWRKLRQKAFVMSPLPAFFFRIIPPAIFCNLLLFEFLIYKPCDHFLNKITQQASGMIIFRHQSFIPPAILFKGFFF